MRFINKETGMIIPGRTELWLEICSGRNCEEDCPISKLCDDTGTCGDWVFEHPYDAAKLIGYEAMNDFVEPAKSVEEKRLVEHQDEETGDLYYTVEKEGSMDKPRICDVMGLEINERATYKDPNGGTLTFFINDDGILGFVFNTGEPISEIGIGYALSQAINHPERVSREPLFTQREIDRAQNLLEVVGDGELKQVGDMTTLKIDGKIVYLRKGAFPSLRPEQTVSLSSIVQVAL